MPWDFNWGVDTELADKELYYIMEWVMTRTKTRAGDGNTHFKPDKNRIKTKSSRPTIRSVNTGNQFISKQTNQVSHSNWREAWGGNVLPKAWEDAARWSFQPLNSQAPTQDIDCWALFWITNCCCDFALKTLCLAFSGYFCYVWNVRVIQVVKWNLNW